MKKKNLLFILVPLLAVITSAYVYTDTGKAGKTGSPSEGTCADCHNKSALNAGGGSIVITSDIPSWKYVAGTTYHITVTVNEPSVTLFGLGVEALRNSDKGNAGKLIITNSAETHLLKASNGRINVVQQLDGGVSSTPGSKAFTFDWMAPASDSGAVTFYASGIAGIKDVDETDDNAYSSSQVVNSPSTGVGIEEAASAVNFSVYPNPVTDVLNISIKTYDAGKVTATLYNLTGEKVADLFTEKNYVGIDKQIPVSSSWAKGMYLLRVTQNGKSSIQRVTIQ